MTMLFGRAAECGQIEQALMEARAGSSRVLLAARLCRDDWLDNGVIR